jgi:hypothetical protein
MVAAEERARAEMATAEFPGHWEEPPSETELDGLPPDPWAGPPDGDDAWLADLPGVLREEYLDATAAPTGPEVLKAGFWDRTGTGGAGFAAGGAADRVVPGAALAGLTGDAWAAGWAGWGTTS